MVCSLFKNTVFFLGCLQLKCFLLFGYLIIKCTLIISSFNLNNDIQDLSKVSLNSPNLLLQSCNFSFFQVTPLYWVSICNFYSMVFQAFCCISSNRYKYFWLSPFYSSSFSLTRAQKSFSFPSYLFIVSCKSVRILKMINSLLAKVL